MEKTMLKFNKEVLYNKSLNNLQTLQKLSPNKDFLGDLLKKATKDFHETILLLVCQSYGLTLEEAESVLRSNDLTFHIGINENYGE